MADNGFELHAASVMANVKIKANHCKNELIDMKGKFFLIIFLTFNTVCFSKQVYSDNCAANYCIVSTSLNSVAPTVELTKTIDLTADKNCSHTHYDLQQNYLVRSDSSRHHFISRISISLGLFNYWSLLNFERYNYSLANSYHLALISSKRNIAFKLGSITEGESLLLNPNSKDGFRSGTFGYIGVTKCFDFKRINYNIGLAGSFLAMQFYPEITRNRIGGGLFADISFNITKRFFVTAYYINSVSQSNQTEFDNYFGCSFGINLYEGKTRIW